MTFELTQNGSFDSQTFRMSRLFVISFCLLVLNGCESEASASSGKQNSSVPEQRKNFSVFVVDFSHVATPFIISLWIGIAGLAKIGEY